MKQAEAQNVIFPAGKPRERTVAARLRETGDVGYVGAFLHIQVSCEYCSEKAYADEGQSTYVPALTLGMLLHIS